MVSPSGSQNTGTCTVTESRVPPASRYCDFVLNSVLREDMLKCKSPQFMNMKSSLFGDKVFTDIQIK